MDRRLKPSAWARGAGAKERRGDVMRRRRGMGHGFHLLLPLTARLTCGCSGAQRARKDASICSGKAGEKIFEQGILGGGRASLGSGVARNTRVMNGHRAVAKTNLNRSKQRKQELKSFVAVSVLFNAFSAPRGVFASLQPRPSEQTLGEPTLARITFSRNKCTYPL